VARGVIDVARRSSETKAVENTATRIKRVYLQQLNWKVWTVRRDSSQIFVQCDIRLFSDSQDDQLSFLLPVLLDEAECGSMMLQRRSDTNTVSASAWQRQQHQWRSWQRIDTT
jgi:hypothetical protein